MHEAGLGRRLVEVALEHARRAGAARVVAVRGVIADAAVLDPATLELHFLAAAEGTPAERARLELRTELVPARCRACRARYTPADHHLLECPTCGSTDGELDGPTGVRVESLEVEGP